MSEPQEENLYQEAINAQIPKDIPFTLNEREFLLVGVILMKAEKQFFAEYENMAKAATETENVNPEFHHTYAFVRDGALILERLVAKMQKAVKEHGESEIEFSQLEPLIDKLNHIKGGLK